MGNIYKELRENYEFKKGGRRITQKELSQIFMEDYYCTSLTHGAIRKLETGERNLKNVDEVTAYAKFFNVTADYLLGIRENAVVDENIAMIGRVTGLSDNAINTLKKVNENKEEYRKYEVLHLIDTLNLIMDEPISFMLFLDHIGDYIDNKYTIPLHYDNKLNDYTESISEPPKTSLVDVPRREKENHIVLGALNNNPDSTKKYIHRQIPVSFVETYHIDTIRKVLDVWKKEYEKKNNKQKDGD